MLHDGVEIQKVKGIVHFWLQARALKVTAQSQSHYG